MSCRINRQKYPALVQLLERIIQHRRKCPLWKSAKGQKCFNCHYGLITGIEREHGVD